MSEAPQAPESRRLWDASFAEQIERGAYNTAPVEAVVRTLAYHFRQRAREGGARTQRFLEIGCGAGPNLVWLAEKGVRVTGVDISPVALRLARRHLELRGLLDRVDALAEASAAALPFADGSFDGVIEACVFQHLARAERLAAFAEVRRLVRQGGVFVGYMLDVDHTAYRLKRGVELADDPGTLLLDDGSSRLHLTNLGVCHFFRPDEIAALLAGFSVVDPCLTTYYLPRAEARRRGFDEYLQSMWTVYAVK